MGIGLTDSQGSSMTENFIHQEVVAFKIQRWLDGSRWISDRPTLAELSENGYVVMHSDDTVNALRTLKQIAKDIKIKDD